MIEACPCVRARSTVRIGQLANVVSASPAAHDVRRKLRRDLSSAPVPHNYNVKRIEEIALLEQRNDKAQDERK
jgi:hypothetical protein